MVLYLIIFFFIALIGLVIILFIRSRQREKSRRSEEALLRTRSDFLSNISHEMRTPMNGIIDMVDQLSEKVMDQESSQLVRSLRVCAEDLLVIVNDVLGFSKLEAGKVDLEKMPFSLGQSVQHLVPLLQERLKEKNINLQLCLDEGLAEFYLGDVTRIKQVLLNFLSNAIKFTQSGGQIILKVHRQKNEITEESLDHLVLSVEDTGMGIAEENLNLIFNSFSQVDASITRRFGGTGLGLSISQKLVQLMGGQIWVESQLGRGSEFFFSIDLVRVQMSVDKTEIYRKSAKDFSHLKILLAEDHKMNQKVVLRLLQKMNCEPCIVENGQEALEELVRVHYDVVLMDIQMPVMSGLEATQEIRKKELSMQQPYIIALTASNQAHEKKLFLAKGMNDHISKPLRLEDLENALDKYQSFHELEKAV